MFSSLDLNILIQRFWKSMQHIFFEKLPLQSIYEYLYCLTQVGMFLQSSHVKMDGICLFSNIITNSI